MTHHPEQKAKILQTVERNPYTLITINEKEYLCIKLEIHCCFYQC
jgi:hypothetical protein